MATEIDLGKVVGDKGDTGNVIMPAGAITQYAGLNAPDGWLLCDGAEVSRTTYAALFDAIGTAYGTGDGSTTFNLPNMSGRFPIGHASITPSKNSSSSGFNGGNNPYGYDTSTYGNGYFPLGEMGGEAVHWLTTNEIPPHNHGINSGWQGSSGHSVSSEHFIFTKSGFDGTVEAFATPVSKTGGGGAHPQIPPYLALNYMISTGL